MCTNCEHLRTNLVLFAVIEHFRTVPLILRSSSGTAGGPVLRKRRLRFGALTTLSHSLKGNLWDEFSECKDEIEVRRVPD